MKLSLILGITGTFIAVVGLSAYLIATDRDPTLLITVMVAAVPALATLFGISKVQSQTNGTLSELRAELAVEKNENKVLRSLLTPEQAATVPIPDVTVTDAPNN